MALFNIRIPDILKPKPSETPILNICMMGPRSVGKTTVLTSIFFETQDSVCGSRLYMKALDTNTEKLTNYHTMLVDAVDKGNAANLPASNTESSFKFGLGLKGQQPTLHLNVQDFPGEYLISKESEVNEYMAKATVVLIAIDTPYMMEEDGYYNVQKNKVDIVTKYLKNNPANIQDKLVLFVPLKCELYAHTGRIEEVSEKVQQTYSDLIAYFKQNNIASFVTPILTLGGMEFDKMIDNTSGIGDVEKIATYRSYVSKPKYAPLFCPQPLYYLLTYVTNYYQWQKTQGNDGLLSGIMNSIYAFFMRDEDFFNEVQKICKYMIYNKNGFSALTGNSILRLN